MQEAVEALFEGLSDADVDVPAEILNKIAALAEFAVRARTHVGRDSSNSKNLTYLPEPEAPTRLAQQLCQLAKGSARLRGRTVVTERDLVLVTRVAFDCIPALRFQILNAIIRGRELKSNIPRSTLCYAKQDLELLQLFTNRGFTPLAEGLLERAGVRSPNVPHDRMKKRENR